MASSDPYWTHSLRVCFSRDQPFECLLSVYRDEKLASVREKLWIALTMSRMDRNELPQSPYRIDLSEHSAEKVCAFLTECVEIARPMP